MSLLRFARAACLALALPAGAVAAFDVDPVTPSGDALAPVRAALDAEDFAGALQLLDGIDPSAESLTLVGFANRKLGQLEAAAVAYNGALTLEPDHLGALSYQGQLYLMQGDPVAARANLMRLRELCDTCEAEQALTEAIMTGGW